MEIAETQNATTIQLSIGHQAVKMVLSTVAAFLAGKAAETVFDKAIEYRMRNAAVDTTATEVE